MQLKKLFSNLPGTWHFNRVINNSAENSMSGNVVGKANFSIIDEKDHICLQDFKNDKRQIKRKFDFLFCQNSFA